MLKSDGTSVILDFIGEQGGLSNIRNYLLRVE
jgi:hypothetical protein